MMNKIRLNMMAFRSRAIVFSVLTLISSGLYAEIRYKIEQIDHTSEFSTGYFFIEDINNYGDVVGSNNEYIEGKGSIKKAFLYTKDSELINIDAIWKEKLNSLNIISTNIIGINDNGDIIGMITEISDPNTNKEKTLESIVVQIGDQVKLLVTNDLCRQAYINNNAEAIFRCDSDEDEDYGGYTSTYYEYKGGNLSTFEIERFEYYYDPSINFLGLNNESIAFGYQYSNDVDGLSREDPIIRQGGNTIYLDELDLSEKIYNEKDDINLFTAKITDINNKGQALINVTHYSGNIHLNENEPSYNHYIANINEGKEGVIIDPLGSNGYLKSINNSGNIIGSVNSNPILYISGNSSLENGEVHDLNSISETGDFRIISADQINDHNFIIGQMEKNDEDDGISQSFIAKPIETLENDEARDQQSDSDADSSSDASTNNTGNDAPEDDSSSSKSDKKSGGSLTLFYCLMLLSLGLVRYNRTV